jgi:elongation factor G
MKVYTTPEIRNVALLGHGDSGKTSLTSAFLFSAGTLNRLGKVDDGTATTDFDEEEIERKISLQVAIAHTEWQGCKINLIDTPGYAAFMADAKVAVAVADLGLLLIEAVSGVQVVTEKTFGFAEEQNLPLIFVLSKLDRENASFQRGLEAIQERFGRAAVPIQLPIGNEHAFEGVIDLLRMKAVKFDKGGSGKMHEEEMPPDLADQAAEARAALVEMIAETDEGLMETFFDAGDLNDEQLIGGLRGAILSRQIFPVLCSSATHLIGTQPLLDAIVNLAPAPGARRHNSGRDPRNDEEISRPVSSDQPVSLFVFKTIADPFAGKLSLFRVCSGKLKGDSAVVNTARDNQSERLGTISIPQGKQLIQIEELNAGDLGVVAKLKETQTSDTLADPSQPIVYPRMVFSKPAISFAVEPKSKGDEERISNALARLTEEDPVLQVKRDPQSGELLVSGTGQLHVEVTLSKMRRKFGVEAILHQPKVPYLETIKKKVSNVEGKHKKQSGGRGQFGVCMIDMEPLPRGEGFDFVDKIFGGSIPQNYRPAVEKGIREAADRGWQAGCPVVDFRVTLTDGKYHTVDSSEMAFKIAGSLAFKEAMSKAAPTILEPIMQVQITVPEEYMGDIMGDLSSRRGKPQGMEAQGNQQVIRAQVPMAEMLSYDSTLKSMTSDRGSYTMEFDHYEEAPAHVKEKIIAERAADNESKSG